MAIYMKYADVDGSATAAGHEKWITCDSIQWGAGRALATPTGSGKNREGSMLSVSEVVITKAQDNASPKLFRKSLDGTKGEKVTIHLVTTSDQGVNTILEVLLDHTVISGYSTSSGGDRPHESVSMNCADIECSFYNQKMEGTEASDKFTVGYNIATAVAR